MAADTGQGGTLAGSTTSTLGCIQSIQLPEWLMERIEHTCLEDTGFMKFLAGDVEDPGEIVATIVFDAETGPPESGVTETWTVTFPIGGEGNAVAATLAGTGFIRVRSWPNMAINELMTMDLTISFDGETGPAFTAEAAA